MNNLIENIVKNFFNINSKTLKNRKDIINETVKKFYLKEGENVLDDIQDRDDIVPTYVLDKIASGDIESSMAKDKTDDEILLTNAPIIYAFITSDIDDAIKIGYTDQGAEKRLSQWRTKYNNVQPLGWWTSMEINKATEKVFFKDYPVHDRTIARGYARLIDKDFKDIEESKGLTNLHVSREFFRKYSNKTDGQIENLSKEIIEDILKEMKLNIIDGTANFTTYTLQDDGTVNKASSVMTAPEIFSETSLQRECIDNGVKAIKEYNLKGDFNKPLDMLMAAVMRFGKTRSAYQIIKESGIKYALVTSAKADTRQAWRNDINHINYINDFCFIEFNGNYEYIVSEKAETKDGIRIVTKSVQDSDIIAKKRNEGKTVIVYATLQDLSGKPEKVTDINLLSVNEAKTNRIIKDKHQYLFNNPPEIIVIDETHFGTHSLTYGSTTGLSGDDDADRKAAEKEAKAAEKIISPIKSNIRLQCSGTPYYILASGEFSDNDKVIITKVSFSDMLNARDKWIENNPNVDPSKSPYYGIPNIKKFGMKLTKEAEKAALDAKLDISLTELFKNDTLKFIHEDAIINLFSALFGSHGKQQPGFMNKRQIEEGKLFQHIVICTPSIDSANLLSKLLVDKDIIDINDRKVLLAVERREGGTQYIKAEFKNSDELNNELNKLDKAGKKSVTITVNRFLTGVSVPLWDAMFMMKDTRSPQEYDQAIFRICTRNVANATDNKTGEKIKVNRKENVYLIDFNISRMFKMTIDSAVAECKAKKLSKPSDMRAIIEEHVKNIPMLVEESVWDAENGKKVLNGLKNIDVEDLLIRYMEYDANKSIEDSIDQKLKNNAFSSFCNNINNLKLINHFNEEGLGNSGPKNSEGTDIMDFNNVSLSKLENFNDEDELIANNRTENKTSKDITKETIETILKKFKSMLKNLLYSSLCFEELPEDTDEFLKYVLENKECEYIIEQFGLDVDTVDNVINALSVKEKTEINFMLLQLKTLVDDKELKSKSPALGFINAIKKLGRLDNKQSSEKEVALVITPDELVKKMLNKVPEETMRNAESILEVNSKTGEFLVGIYNKYGKSVAEKVKIVAGDDRCKIFIKKILNILGISEYNILDIEDLDGNGKYDVKDFLKLENSEILDMNNKKHWDVVLMNPPYGAKKFGDEFLHHKFTKKCISISNYVVDIMPYKIVYDTTESQILTDYKKFYDKTLISVEEESGSQFTGTGMQNVAIYVFNNSKKDGNDIMIKDIVGTTKYIKTLNDAGYNKIELELFKYIKADNINHNTFKKPNKFVATQENIKIFVMRYCQKLIKKYPNSAFLTANLANGGMNAKFFSPLVGKIFTNINELEQNLIDRKAAYTTILTFDTEYAANNCKCAMCNPVLRYGLYKVQDNQSMNSKCYKYIPNIDWEDDRVLTDEGLLEVCGCPKDKAKEYAEYCRKYIEENVDKKK